MAIKFQSPVRRVGVDFIAPTNHQREKGFFYNLNVGFCRSRFHKMQWWGGRDTLP